MNQLTSLAALMDDADVAGNYIELPVNIISPDPDQPRKTFLKESLDDLADSIRAQGVVQPILVRPADDGSYIIIAGERRWRACQLAGVDIIPTVVRDIDEATVRAIQLIENINREDVPPLEEAEAIAALVKELGNQKAAQQALGKGKTYISLRLSLLKLPDVIKALAESGVTKDAETLDLLGRLYKLDQPAAKHFIDRPELVAREPLRSKIKLRKAAQKEENEGTSATGSASGDTGTAHLALYAKMNNKRVKVLGKHPDKSGYVWVELPDGQRQAVNCAKTEIRLAGYK